mmetsp:Transcript_3710/g.12734  ORF Transcript_3710/g.12734 Transcript_3710/m.12734 type:complete len:282 (+) Transcript_3710:1345-2190(+)
MRVPRPPPRGRVPPAPARRVRRGRRRHRADGVLPRPVPRYPGDVVRRRRVARRARREATPSVRRPRRREGSDRGAHGGRDDHMPRGRGREGCRAVRRPPRKPVGTRAARRRQSHVAVPAAERGDRGGLLRRAQEPDVRVRDVRLRRRGIRTGGHRALRHPRERRGGGRVVVVDAPRQGGATRARHVRAAEGGAAAAVIRGGGASGGVRESRRQGDGERDAKERHREVLRRGHLAEEEAAVEAEGGEEAHETHRERGHPERGVRGAVEHAKRATAKMNSLPS